MTSSGTGDRTDWKLRVTEALGRGGKSYETGMAVEAWGFADVRRPLKQ